MLALSHLHGAEQLKTRAIVFLKANTAAVVKTTGWHELIRSNPDLVSEVVAVMSAM
jgi:hypothetical protein